MEYGEILNWDLIAVSKALQSRQLSPKELTKLMLERIEAINPELNAFITVLHEEAMASAAKAEEEIMQGTIKSPLHGIPIGLKDLIYTKGIRTTMGSKIYEDFLPDYDASVVTKLKAAGAIIVGKLNTHEFAYGTTGDTSYFGPVRNPHDTAKITGGSSSGSGAAVAAHLCYAALGTDTGGSIRIPASFCGVVGMKPTFGRVSKWGVYPLCPTLDHVGPMTKTVRDNAMMLNALAGYDPQDPFSAAKEPEDFTEKLEEGVQGCVIGIPSSFFFEQLDSEIKVKMEQVISIYKDLGASIRFIEIENLEELSEAHGTVLRSEAYATHKLDLDNKTGLWEDEVKDRLQTGEDVRAFEYLEAQEIRKRAIQSFNKVFEQVDVLLTPNTPIMPLNLYEREVVVNHKKEHIFSVLNKFTGPSNLTGLPCMSVPCGLSNAGLPIGFQLTGRAFDESRLYRFAYSFEQAVFNK
ncbi:Asp-tRNA(Asn)/Glu-tRNA(Gln) amidotransferase subunit GatA [Bacillus aerolatus]|uniref:Asp-tRNA(Asn)/Glu-tRNA(Gln) amidotransferase subunit GatA n=1 Tax=Bacillus aerolatus TaxID=2653354 RepID=A0A6I1FLZ5_9BACI|nr:Asp-tRNA(Asn)/Glu-tRNA(Gln) amidotransferase subunit GatA [Bacillus aerolatus]